MKGMGPLQRRFLIVLGTRPEAIKLAALILELRRRDPLSIFVCATGQHAGNASDPHTEANLDSGLDETFPASDPVSIHPGAD